MGNEGSNPIDPTSATANQLILKITQHDYENLDLALRYDPTHVNEYSGEMTALHFAALTESVEAVRVLLKHGADPALEISEGLWAAHTAEAIAEACGYEGVVHMLRHDAAALRAQGAADAAARPPLPPPESPLALVQDIVRTCTDPLARRLVRTRRRQRRLAARLRAVESALGIAADSGSDSGSDSSSDRSDRSAAPDEDGKSEPEDAAPDTTPAASEPQAGDRLQD